MRLTIQKPSMASFSSVVAQRSAISKHICPTRRHNMRINAAAASDAAEVRSILSFLEILNAVVLKIPQVFSYLTTSATYPLCYLSGITYKTH